jgi:hypothetical protein
MNQHTKGTSDQNTSPAQNATDRGTKEHTWLTPAAILALSMQTQSNSRMLTAPVGNV